MQHLDSFLHITATLNRLISSVITLLFTHFHCLYNALVSYAKRIRDLFVFLNLSLILIDICTLFLFFFLHCTIKCLLLSFICMCQECEDNAISLLCMYSDFTFKVNFPFKRFDWRSINVYITSPWWILSVKTTPIEIISVEMFQYSLPTDAQSERNTCLVKNYKPAL